MNRVKKNILMKPSVEWMTEEWVDDFWKKEKASR